MEFPFIGGSYTGRSKDVNAQKCVNLYLNVDSEGGKSTAQLIGTPGLEEFYDPSSTYPVRNMRVVGSYVYAVIGTTLYKIDSNGVGVSISGTLGTDSGYVWMADNGTELMIVDPGRDGYIYETVAGGNLTQISDGDFPTPETVTFLDGYFVVTESDTGKVWISASYDGTSWDALDFATAEKFPDNLLSQVVHKGQLWLAGSKSIEVWYNSGAADYPLENIGVTIPEGIGAAASMSRDKDSIYMINEEGQAVRSQGYDFVPISTPQVDYAISQYVRYSDAIGYIYTQEGHRFWVVNFPSAQTTWVYDITTGFWHERLSYRSDLGPGYYGRHRSNCYAKFGTKHLVGDYYNGKIYQLKTTVYWDDDEVIKRQRRTIAMTEPGTNNRITHNSLEIDFETGVGLNTGQGSDPQAMLKWSDDEGNTWSNEHWRGIGKMGEYGTRVRWNRLGSSRARIYNLEITDPVKVVIIRAHLDAELGVS